MIRRTCSLVAVQRSIRAGRWSPSIIESARQLLHTKTLLPTPQQWLATIDLLHNTVGVDDTLFENLLDLARTRSLLANADVSFRLAAIANQLGRYERATTLISAHLPGKLSKLYRYPRLLLLAQQVNPAPDLDPVAAELAMTLSDRCTLFSDWLRARKPDSIALVGNGPQTRGMALGEEIDAHKLVIRFNRADTSENFRQDIGSRSDIRVISPSYVSQLPADTTLPLAVTGCLPFDRPGRYWQKLASLRQSPTVYFDPSVWRSLVAQLHAPPSAGLLCLAELSLFRAQVGAISVYGISTGARSSRNHYSDRHRRSTRHDWDKEARLAGEYARQLQSAES